MPRYSSAPGSRSDEFFSSQPSHPRSGMVLPKTGVSPRIFMVLRGGCDYIAIFYSCLHNDDWQGQWPLLGEELSFIVGPIPPILASCYWQETPMNSHLHNLRNVRHRVRFLLSPANRRMSAIRDEAVSLNSLTSSESMRNRLTALRNQE